jgi:hypothetical protein
MSDHVSRLDYCRYLLVSRINYTLTNFADHCERFSHDAVNRYLRGERITPRLVWDNVRSQVAENSHGAQPYRRVGALEWSEAALSRGKRIKIKGFPRGHKVQCFRGAVITHRTDYVVNNDLGQDSTEAAPEACGFRWKIEQLHREAKQLTGLERCQCRKARIQRNHIGCALLVWVRFKELAARTGRTMYQLKHGLLDEYLVQ